ncbi:sucrose phosphorylase [Maribacter sp. 2308TA10-17]|uniref:sucrose phosphorylase n=1 Tax=Maribacter sp. 2308TA10-17 TaxID=3386276 RepID=UPI0039BD8A81
MRNKIQLITYVDRVGCNNLKDLKSLMIDEFKGLFGGIHILPFFYPIDGADAGFDPIDHTKIDERLGDWNDLKSLSAEVPVMADLIVNHVSAKSNAFQDYLEKGDDSEYSNLFLTKDKVFPNGLSDAEIKMIYRPRPGSPFTEFDMSNGLTKAIWTTFTQNQIDIDVEGQMGIAYLEGILDTFQKAGITMIRLDAAGYAIKRKGTSCFMIDETFDFIAELTKKAKNKGIKVLVEIHSFYKTQIEIAKRVDYVYDFALPVLVLDCLYNRDASNLKKWLKIAPRNVITVLDTHDGIGIVDVASENNEPGLIPDQRLNNIVEKIHQKSRGTSKMATGAAASNLDLYQVNCTYFEALGKNENDYLISRAIQFFVPGVPQVYYVGLLAGENDMELLGRTNVGRDINRHNYSRKEIEETIHTPFFSRLKNLMLFRNTHPSFDGSFNLIDDEDHRLNIRWVHNEHWTQLSVNLETSDLKISYSGDNNISRMLEL